MLSRRLESAHTRCVLIHAPASSGPLAIIWSAIVQTDLRCTPVGLTQPAIPHIVGYHSCLGVNLRNRLDADPEDRRFEFAFANSCHVPGHAGDLFFRTLLDAA